MTLKGGAKVNFNFDQLDVGSSGLPTATGTMTLDAVLDESQIDLAKAQIPGVTLGPLNGAEQHLTISLGKFSIRPDGTFDASDLAVGVQARIQQFGGKLVQPKS